MSGEVLRTIFITRFSLQQYHFRSGRRIQYPLDLEFAEKLQVQGLGLLRLS